MLNLLWDTIRLDIFDLNAVYSSEQMNLLQLPLKTGVQQRGLFLRSVAFCWHLVKSLGSYRFHRFQRLPDGHVIFAFFSKNNRDALGPLHQRMPNSSFLSNKRGEVLVIPMFPAHLLSLLFLPLLLVRFLQARGYRRKSFRIALDAYLVTYGYYVVCRLLFRCWSPSAVVVSNDHVYYNRVLCAAAHAEGVLTFYIQHASVSDNFPPLFFDYALLEGEDALRKYVRAGSTQTRVFLVGTPKFDAYYASMNRSYQLQTIGICTSAIDSLDTVASLCFAVRKNFSDLHMVLRPHPNDHRFDEWVSLTERVGVSFSNSREEISFRFLQEVDAVVAGETNILLEGALLNVYPIYYDYENIQLDVYGFLRNGLVDTRHSRPEELLATLRSLMTGRPESRQRTKYWCETVNTIYDGHSTELAIQVIEEVQRGSLNLSRWDEITDVEGLKAFRPKENAY